jgi:hypothetical protein
MGGFFHLQPRSFAALRMTSKRYEPIIIRTISLLSRPDGDLGGGKTADEVVRLEFLAGRDQGTGGLDLIPNVP